MVFHRVRAERLTVAGGRATGAGLADGTRLPAGQVVLAAGSHSGRLAGVPEEVLPPVRPVKGQVLRLRMPGPPAGGPPFLSRTVRAVVRGSPLYLVPRENGELVVGATSEELGWDTTVTAGGVYELLRDAHELVPGITELPLVETCAGLRPGSPDNAPLLGPTALPGLHLATGHFRNGVLLTPVTGDVDGRGAGHRRPPRRGPPLLPRRFTPATSPGRRARPCPRGAARMSVTGTPALSVSVNGEAARSRRHTLDRLVATLTTAPAGVAAAVNETVVPRAQWPATPLGDGDRVEVLTAVQGG